MIFYSTLFNKNKLYKILVHFFYTFYNFYNLISICGGNFIPLNTKFFTFDRIISYSFG